MVKRSICWPLACVCECVCVSVYTTAQYSAHQNTQRPLHLVIQPLQPPKKARSPRQSHIGTHYSRKTMASLEDLVVLRDKAL